MNKTVRVAEIAKYFRVPVYHVQEWISTGELIATVVRSNRFGYPVYRVDEAEFEAFKLRRAEPDCRNRHDAIPITTSHEVRKMDSREIKNMDKTMTPPQVAKFLRVRKTTVLDWIRTGELRAINISNFARPSYRVDPADLEDFKLRRSNRAAIPTPLGRPRRD
ncbi:MAG: helix-turn-helix domain-containing protein [Planctomycetaceae bacterium]|nr:helix-turn-helix domain-containing protein [Planctomycetaceae bacterium]